MDEIKFQLDAPFKPAGSQPQAIEELNQQLNGHLSKAVLVGVTGSGKTFTMANVITHLQRPVLIMTHNKTLAAQLYREFKGFFPNNAVEYFISYYDYYQPEAYVPASDTYIEKEATINEEIEMLRLRATSSLLERRDVIIVASVSSIYGLGSPETYEQAALIMNVGEMLPRDQLIKNLITMQYKRNDLAYTRGTFQVKGDVVEIIPAYSGDAIRIEFFGNEIERLSRVDIIERTVTITLPKIILYPAKHFITDIPLLERAVINIQKELKDQVAYFTQLNKLLEAQRIQQRTMFDLEMLKEMKYCNGIENYSRHLTHRLPGLRASCLIDYFPKDMLFIIDESHVTIPQIRGMHAGDRSRKQTLVEHGFRLPSALDNRPLNLPEFEGLANNVLYVSATPGEYEFNKTSVHVQQIIRPTGLLDPKIAVQKTQDQMIHLMKEIQFCIEQNERVLVVTLTKKMAEDLTEYFSDMDIKIRYMHSDIDSLERTVILRDLRKGEFDVLVGINLLREGIDLPEVALVAVLDADKQGFLRSKQALVQTIGRAARNIKGRVIMYADTITPAMQHAIDETKQRRTIQAEYNKVNKITPKTISKEIVDIIERENKQDEKQERLVSDISLEYHKKQFSSGESWKEALKKDMLKAADELNFEKAAFLRDILSRNK